MIIVRDELHLDLVSCKSNQCDTVCEDTCVVMIDYPCIVSPSYSGT